MSNLKVGYAQVNVNPPLGIGVDGYYIPRYAKGFLDDIEVRVAVVSLNNKKMALISVDICGFYANDAEQYCAEIERVTSIPKENILLSGTHTHTGPCVTPPKGFKVDEEQIKKYVEFMRQRIADAAKLALDDLKPAKMGHIVGQAPERVAYIRRYKMKDGSTYTCPPIDDPNIDYPLGTLDQRVNVVRFDREGGETVVLMNYGLHADTIGGEMISSDWPGWMRRTLEKALDGTKCIFFAGAQGDVGSTNVHPKDGDMNDTEISFDNEMKSPGMARFVGRALAGTVLQVYDKVKYVDVDDIDIIKKDVIVPSNVPTKEELPLAKKYKELHEQGRDDEIPYKAMQLTTAVAEALRMCRLENGPESYTVGLTGVKLGPVAMVGIPGEVFTETGVAIKAIPGWEMIMPCALSNGALGYFPSQSAYEEGGYEARSSQFKSGVTEKIVDGAKELLGELK